MPNEYIEIEDDVYVVRLMIERFSGRDRGGDAARIEPPDVPRAEVREPHRTEANANGIAAFTGELLDDFIRRWIDAAEGKFKGRHP